MPRFRAYAVKKHRKIIIVTKTPARRFYLQQQATMQNHLVLMACSATKASTAAPAIDLYQGVMYSTFRANVPVTRPAVLILSAKHGFIEADRVIEPYEQRMTEARADEMLAYLPAFDTVAWPWHAKTIMLAGGKTYRRVMRAAIARRMRLGSIDTHVTLRETAGGIGYQRAQLGAYLRGMGRLNPGDLVRCGSCENVTPYTPPYPPDQCLCAECDRIVGEMREAGEL
ncbi:TPA: hypothetical protein QDA78_005657 [Burkholderia vietnamiensis]|nr:hypothetical protein [Burkholderia vietnamiensis]